MQISFSRLCKHCFLLSKRDVFSFSILTILNGELVDYIISSKQCAFVGFVNSKRSGVLANFVYIIEEMQARNLLYLLNTAMITSF